MASLFNKADKRIIIGKIKKNRQTSRVSRFDPTVYCAAKKT